VLLRGGQGMATEATGSSSIFGTSPLQQLRQMLGRGPAGGGIRSDGEAVSDDLFAQVFEQLDASHKRSMQGFEAVSQTDSGGDRQEAAAADDASEALEHSEGVEESAPLLVAAPVLKVPPTDVPAIDADARKPAANTVDPTASVAAQRDRLSDRSSIAAPLAQPTSVPASARTKPTVVALKTDSFSSQSNPKGNATASQPVPVAGVVKGPPSPIPGILQAVRKQRSGKSGEAETAALPTATTEASLRVDARARQTTPSSHVDANQIEKIDPTGGDAKGVGWGRFGERNGWGRGRDVGHPHAGNDRARNDSTTAENREANSSLGLATPDAKLTEEQSDVASTSVASAGPTGGASGGAVNASAAIAQAAAAATATTLVPGIAGSSATSSAGVSAASGSVAGGSAASNAAVIGSGSLATTGNVGPRSSIVGAASSGGEGNQVTDNRAAADRVRLVQRVSRSFQQLGPQGGQLRLRLHPESLGSMQLEVRMNGHSLSARMVTESEQAKQRLQETAGELRRRLDELGIQVQQLQIEVQSVGTEQDAGQNATFDQGNPSQQQHQSSTNHQQHSPSPAPRQPARAPAIASGSSDGGGDGRRPSDWPVGGSRNLNLVA
jgi:flagellar hook-length control protein FliK